MIVIGSVARDTARADSDVDVYLVVTDEAYSEAQAARAIASVSQQGVTYPGGYVDIKLASPGYISTAVERGDDPARASFLQARVALDKTGRIPDWIDGIANRRLAGTT